MTNYEFLFFSLLLFIAGIVKLGNFARMLMIYFAFLFLSLFFIFNGNETAVFFGISIATFSSINLILWMYFQKMDDLGKNVLKEDI